jgi:hypothetical protein
MKNKGHETAITQIVTTSAAKAKVTSVVVLIWGWQTFLPPMPKILKSQ